MKRIFSIIAVLVALMVMLAGGGAYWLASSAAKDTEQAAIASVANSLAINLSLQLDTLQRTVDGIAQSADVVTALASANPELIQATSSKLQGIIPHTLRLRLLPVGISEPDQSSVPHMGFGDLEMVRATLTDKPKPVIQGEGEHRHLAVTSPVHLNQQVIGVVLASIEPDLPQKIIGLTQFDQGFIELKQDQLLLGKLGHDSAQREDPEVIEVRNSRWRINFSPNIQASTTDISLLFAIITLPVLLVGLTFFRGYRKLNEYVHQDQSSILKAAKDMMQGKSVGNYPMHLDEMMPIIASLAQFKRVIDYEGSPQNKNDSNENSFFDESFDIDFLEDSQPITPPSTSVEPASLLPEAPDLNQASAKDKTSAVTSPPVSSLGHADEFVAPMHDADKEESLIPDSWDLDFSSFDNETSVTPGKNDTAPAASPALPANIFRTFDIRGIAGQTLDATVVNNLGRAFASEVRRLDIKTVVVARDGRLSSPELSGALIKGITAAGCDVLDLGLVPTPVLYFVSHHTDGRTGVMVTGSSNPVDWNGLKLVLNGEVPNADMIQSLKKRVDNGDYTSGEGSVEKNSLFSNEYVGLIADDTNIVRPMTVVVDSSNGATGALAPLLLKAIGCDVIELNCEIDGHFPNHEPNPGKPENLEALIKAVKLNHADIGLCFDGDGDRLGVVDSSGKIIWPDRQMMLFARDVLASKTGAEILFDTACSKHLPGQIAKRGGRGITCKSGHDAIRTLMKETGAALAGTMSGHFFFNDRWFGFDDALYAAVRLIEILSADMRSSSELFQDLPESLSTPELRVTLPEGEPEHLIEQMFSSASFEAVIDNTDGLRAEFANGWGLARASTTEPALVFRFEADSREAMSRIQAQFKYLLLQIKPDISLPF